MADGLTDDLITGLGQVRGLRVLGRTSAFTYKAKTVDPRDLAAQHGVRSILQGTIRELGNQLRINAELIGAADGIVLWSTKIDCNRTPVPTGLDWEIARGVLATLHLPDPRPSRATNPASPEAQHLTWNGRFFWNKRGEANLRKAIEFFEPACNADPGYAPAWSGLGDAYIQIGYGSFLRPVDVFPKARAAALTAVKLDPNLAEPHATLGFYHLYFEWNWAEAESEFKQALTLNPNYATAHDWYSYYLTAMGKIEAARRESQIAQELDPLSVPIASDMGFVLHYAHEQDAAIAQLRSTLERDPNFLLAHLFLGRALQAKGLWNEALEEYHKTGALTNWVPTLAGVGYVYAKEHNREGALQILAQFEEMKKQGRYVTSYATALVYCALGDREQALTELQHAVDEKTHWLVWLNRDLRWEPIRSTPGFKKIVEAVGLPQ